jgi:uncharacterized membrane protein
MQRGGNPSRGPALCFGCLLGPVVAAGWLVSTLAGAAAGAATGGVIGALTQAGVSDEEAHVYAEGLRRGGAVVSAKVSDADAGRLQAILDRSAVGCLTELRRGVRLVGKPLIQPQTHTRQNK